MQTTTGDTHLAERLAEGRELFLGYIRRRVNSAELAEDILQDSLLRALRAAPDLRDEERLVPWFYRVLENAIVDSYRRRGTECKHEGGSLPDESQIPTMEPEHEAALCTCSRAIFPTLKPEYVELIESLDLKGEAPETVATRLGITPNNLNVRRHRARQALRHQLEMTRRTCAEHHCPDCTCGTD